MNSNRCSLCGKALDPLCNKTRNDSKEESCILSIWKTNGRVGVLLSDVHAVQGTGRGSATLYTSSGPFKAWMILKHFENLAGWVRIHKSIWVRQSSVIGKVRSPHAYNPHWSVVVNCAPAERVCLQVARRKSKLMKIFPTLEGEVSCGLHEPS